MLVLICGGASSGKSEFAERLISDLSHGNGMTYLATMEKKTDAARARIADHEKRREGRNFQLVECEKNIPSCFDRLQKNVLLECLPTLVSNEMFSEENGSFKFDSDVSDRICSDIRKLSEKCDNLVIVTNDVFSDGRIYDDMTEQYIRQLGELSCRIAAFSDEVYYMTYHVAEKIKEMSC